MFICQHCGEVSAHTHTRAGNSNAWAVGKVSTNNRFHARLIVWGLREAQLAMRADEGIRQVIIMVEVLPKRRAPAVRRQSDAGSSDRP